MTDGEHSQSSEEQVMRSENTTPINLQQNEAEVSKQNDAKESKKAGSSLTLKLETDHGEIDKAIKLESEIFDEEGFGETIEQYSKYKNQSRVISAFDGDERIGVIRLIAGKPERPPFMSDFEIKRKEELEELVNKGKLEEVGTVAVAKEYRNKNIGIELYKAAYKDAKERGITHWGIIMEPKRVNAFNKRLFFAFEELALAKWYMGGNCASYVMNLAEGEKNQSQHNRALYDWFTEGIPDTLLNTYQN